MRPKDFRQYVKEALVNNSLMQNANALASELFGTITKIDPSELKSGETVFTVSLPDGTQKYLRCHGKIFPDEKSQWGVWDDKIRQFQPLEKKAPVDETVTLRELKHIVNETVKVIVKEMTTGSKKMTGPYTVTVHQGKYANQVFLTRKDEETGVHYFYHPDTGTDVPLGTEGPGLTVQRKNIKEMTTTSAVSPINLPGNVRGGWVSKQGGSKRGVEGSTRLGYELTPIGKQDMARKQDPV